MHPMDESTWVLSRKLFLSYLLYRREQGIKARRTIEQVSDSTRTAMRLYTAAKRRTPQ